MSIKLMTQVWESGLPRAKKYIALVYADWANDDGHSIFPSVGHVAWKCGCGERTVQYVTEKLEADGILKYMGESKYRTNEYQMIASKLPKRKPYKEKGAKIAPMTPQKLHPNGAEIAPDPLVTHQIEPLVKENAADAARPTRKKVEFVFDERSLTSAEEMPTPEIFGTNGVVVFGEGQEYAEVEPPLSPEQQMIAGFYSKPAMMDKWYEWEAYRVERKKKLTPTTRNKQIKFLLDQGEDAIAIMEQSMTAGWLGLFPLKQNGHAPKPAQPTPAVPSEEELNRQRADVAAKVAERNAKRKAGIQDPDDF